MAFLQGKTCIFTSPECALGVLRNRVVCYLEVLEIILTTWSCGIGVAALRIWLSGMQVCTQTTCLAEAAVDLLFVIISLAIFRELGYF